jgi:hypothetical protein
MILILKRLSILFVIRGNTYHHKIKIKKVVMFMTSFSKKINPRAVAEIN